MTVPNDCVVLVVEDEPLVRMVAADCLRDEGFTVYEADCAEEALDLIAARHGVDVVFTDIDMPGMSGLDLACEIHRRWPAVHCLLTSGQARPGADQMTVGDRFLAKPYAVGQLGAEIRRAA